AAGTAWCNGTTQRSRSTCRKRKAPRSDMGFRLVANDHLVLRVVDLERMLRCYCEALGCTLEKRQNDIGLIQLRAGSGLIDLVPVDGKLGSSGGATPGKEGRHHAHVLLPD